MQRKISIGIALPNDLKKRLAQKMERWEKFPVRWSKKENLHLSFFSLGYVDDELIFDICEKTKNAVKDMEVFDIDLTKIELGPSQDREAKMIWFAGNNSGKLKKVVENIEKSLGIFNANKKKFEPHIILGRIRKYQWKSLKKIPEISEDFSVLLPVESVEIFESSIVDGKRKFTAIDSGKLRI